MYDMREFIYNILSSYLSNNTVSRISPSRHSLLFQYLLLHTIFHPVVNFPRLQMRNFPKAWMANSGEDIEAKLRSSHGQTLPRCTWKAVFVSLIFLIFFVERCWEVEIMFQFFSCSMRVYLWNWTLHVWKDVMPKSEAIVFHSDESSLRRQSHHVTSEVFCWNSHTTSGKAIHFDRKLLSTFGDITGIQVGYDGFYR